MSAGIIGPFFFENEQGKVVTVNGDRYRAMLNEFLFTKIDEENIETFGFNRTALRATQPKLHSIVCVLFLKIAFSAAELISFGHLEAAIWHRWTIICGNKCTNIWFQQDGATCYTSEARLDVLCPVFEDRILSRRAYVVWPPQSCNSTPLDYYLWGAVKDKCYVGKSETINALKDNIREAIGEIQLHIIDNKF